MKILKILDKSLNQQQKSSLLLLFIGILVVAAPMIGPAYVALFITLAWAAHQALSHRDVWAARVPKWAPTLTAFILALLPFQSGPLLPVDDGLRHLFAYKFLFSYREIYPLAQKLPEVSLWLGYEQLLGWLMRLLDMAATVFLLQAAYTVGVFLIGVRVVARLKLKPLESSTLLVAWLCVGLIDRGYMLRPESWLALWAISAFVLPATVWTIIGLPLMGAYWLAWIYIPLALVFSTWRQRLVSGAVLAFAFLGVVVLGERLEWLTMLWDIGPLIDARVESVAENKPITAYFNFGVAAILTAFVVIHRPQRHNWPLYAIMLWFSLPGQARYLPMILACMWYLTARDLPRTTAKNPRLLGVILTLSLVSWLSANRPPPLTTIPDIDIPAESLVLTPFATETFMIGTALGGRAAMAMELGMAPVPVQKQSQALFRSSPLDCDVLNTYGITHVLTRFPPSPVDCLTYTDVDSGYQLWTVSARNNAASQ